MTPIDARSVRPTTMMDRAVMAGLRANYIRSYSNAALPLMLVKDALGALSGGARPAVMAARG